MDEWFKEWYNTCYNILRKYIPTGKSFDFVITYDDNLVIDRMTSPKRLSKIYEMYPEYNELNTFILDDSPHTYRLNSVNAIPITTYDCECDEYEDLDEDVEVVNSSTDEELLRIIAYIQELERMVGNQFA
jgi:hypothetical protein